MDVLLVAAVTVLYAGAAISSLIQGNKPMAVILTGYCIANVGLIWSMTR